MSAIHLPPVPPPPPHAPATEAAIAAGLGIVTEFVNPPIASPKFCWMAFSGDTLEEETPVGYGATEAEAVRDLLDQIAEAS